MVHHFGEWKQEWNYHIPVKGNKRLVHLCLLFLIFSQIYSLFSSSGQTLEMGLPIFSLSLPTLVNSQDAVTDLLTGQPDLDHFSFRLFSHVITGCRKLTVKTSQKKFNFFFKDIKEADRMVAFTTRSHMCKIESQMLFGWIWSTTLIMSYSASTQWHYHGNFMGQETLEGPAGSTLSVLKSLLQFLSDSSVYLYSDNFFVEWSIALSKDKTIY